MGPSQTHFSPRLAARAKMSLSRAQNIFMPANINFIVILASKRKNIKFDRHYERGLYYTTLPFSLVLFFSSLENHVIHHSPMKGQQENPASLKTFHSNQIFHATVVNAPLILGFSRQKMPVSKRVHQDFPPQEQGSSLLFCLTYFAEIFGFI